MDHSKPNIDPDQEDFEDFTIDAEMEQFLQSQEGGRKLKAHYIS